MKHGRLQADCFHRDVGRTRSIQGDAVGAGVEAENRQFKIAAAAKPENQTERRKCE